MTETAPPDSTVWAVNHCSWREASTLARELAIPQVVAMVLAGRGLSDPAAAREFLECSFLAARPFPLCRHAGRREHTPARQCDEDRKIVVHGDYDADGITATALLLLGLRELGADVDWYLPSRFKEGYGLSRTAVEAISAGRGLCSCYCGLWGQLP